VLSVSGIKIGSCDIVFNQGNAYLILLLGHVSRTRSYHRASQNSVASHLGRCPARAPSQRAPWLFRGSRCWVPSEHCTAAHYREIASDFLVGEPCVLQGHWCRSRYEEPCCLCRGISQTFPQGAALCQCCGSWPPKPSESSSEGEEDMQRCHQGSLSLSVLCRPATSRWIPVHGSRVWHPGTSLCIFVSLGSDRGKD